RKRESGREDDKINSGPALLRLGCQVQRQLAGRQREGHMGGKYVIAEGTHSDGLTWVIWARRHEPHEGDLLSMIRITDASGRIVHGGGRAGQPLQPGHVLNLSS